MKKTYLITVLLSLVAIAANAQWFRVWSGGESTRIAVTDINTVPYSPAGQTLTFGDVNISIAEIDSITIVNPVVITWNEATATVAIPENVEGVTATVSGADVVINNTNVFTEQEFILTGSSQVGSLTYNGDFKCKFHLAGLDLTSTTAGAIDIQCGKRIDLIIEDGTVNTLADAAKGTQKAAFNCQGHLEVSGGGSLTVTGNLRHAFRTKEYLMLKKTVGNITIAKSVGDGIHCGEYFLMNGGQLTLSGLGGDGIQVETDPGSEEVLNGQFIMNGGSIDLTMTTEDTKGIRLDIDTLNKVSPEMYLLDGVINVNLTATAKGSKAIASDGDLFIGSTQTEPLINITVAAETYTDPDSGEENRATGIKADKTLTIAGGNTTIAATGKKSRGVRAETLTAVGGTLTVTNTGSKSQGIKLDNQFVNGQGGTVNGTFKY